LLAGRFPVRPLLQPAHCWPSESSKAQKHRLDQQDDRAERAYKQTA
jgi:hypothetical protein